MLELSDELKAEIIARYVAMFYGCNQANQELIQTVARSLKACQAVERHMNMEIALEKNGNY